MAFPKSLVAFLQETRSQQQIKKMLAFLQLVTTFRLCFPSFLSSFLLSHPLSFLYRIFCSPVKLNM